LRADTAANWTSVNPTLLANEVGLETDTKKLKVGNGSTAWNSLAYFPSIVTGGTVLGNLEIGTTGTLTFEGSTANGFETTLAVTDPTADRTITLPDQSGTVVVTGNASIVNADIAANAEIAVSKLADGAARQLLQTDAAGTGVEWTDNVDVPGTLDVTGAATFDNNVTIEGDLTVNGTTTTIDTETLLVKDKNIELAVVDTPSDLTADGGGITLKGSTDKTITWSDTTDAWTSSEHVDIANGKEYRINGTKVLDATSLGSAVVSSSLTSVGTIGTGVWQGTAIDATYLDSTVVTTSDTGTVTSTMLADGTIVDADISASAEIAVSKLADGAARQLLQTDAAGTGVEWTDNVDIPGTLDVTGATTLDGDLTVDTNTLYVDSTNNRVAIGTTSPVVKFQILGSDAEDLFYLSTGNTAGNTFAQIRGDNEAGIRIRGGGSSEGGTIELGGGLRDTNPGIIKFSTGTSGSSTEKARIDSSGRLLVGTASSTTVNSADSALQLAGNTFSTSSILIRRSQNTAAGPGLVFAASDGTVSSPTSVADDDALGVIRFHGYDGSDFNSYGAEIACYVDGTPGAGDMPGTLAFSTTADGDPSPTERMRIDSSGRLLVGTDSASGNPLLKVQGNVSNSDGGATLAIARGTTPAVGSNILGVISFRQGTDEYIGATIEAQSDAGWTAGSSYPTRLVFSTTASGGVAPTESMRIDNAGILYSVPTYNNSTGTTTNYLRIGSDGQIYRSTSSIAYKTDVEDMDDAYADAILNLRPVWYRSTCAGDNPNHSHWGFIAEEVEQVDPRLCSFKDVEVTYDEEGKQVVTPLETPVVDGVDYASLTPLLLNLIKRQKTQIEDMEVRLAALEGGAS